MQSRQEELVAHESSELSPAPACGQLIITRTIQQVRRFRGGVKAHPEPRIVLQNVTYPWALRGSARGDFLGGRPGVIELKLSAS